MSRINQRIDASLYKPNSTTGKMKKRKAPSMPPKDKKEANRILDRLYERSPTLALCCQMSALTGLRYSDASWLTYDDFYDEHDNFKPFFTLCQQKTFRMRVGRKDNPMSDSEAYRKSSVTIYTNKEIQNIVEESRIFSTGGGFLFSNPRSRKKLEDGTYIERPMSVVSADWHHQKVKNDMRLSYTLGTHSWRKFFALLLVQNGATVEKIRDLLGQSSLISTNAYLHSFTGDLQQHINELSLGH